MTRFHATFKGNIPFTIEEEKEWDAKEAAYVPITTVPMPTKEQLIKELQSIAEKINNLQQ